MENDLSKKGHKYNCDNNIEEKDKKGAVKYLKQYFYPLQSSHILMVCKESFYTSCPEKSYITLHIQDVKTLYFNKLPTEVSKYWYKENEDIYTMVNEPFKPRFSGNTINVFAGFKHHEPRKIQEFSEKTLQALEMFKRYILDVLCSGDDKQLQYILLWCANMCQGNKNSSALYFKSIEGTGKSTFTDFLREHVMGRELAIKSTSLPLKNGYNKGLCGKALVVMEELATNKFEWEQINSTFKDLITDNETVVTLG